MLYKVEYTIPSGFPPDPIDGIMGHGKCPTDQVQKVTRHWRRVAV